MKLLEVIGRVSLRLYVSPLASCLFLNVPSPCLRFKSHSCSRYLINTFKRKWNFTTPSLLRANKAAFRLLGCSQPMRRVLTLTAEVHLGRCSPPAADSRSAALRSPPRRTTELRVGGARRRLAVSAVGTERSTAAQTHRAYAVFFRGFNASQKS